MKVWLTSSILRGVWGETTFLEVIEGGQSIFSPSKRGGANDFFVDNNYNHNLYFVQYERILPISCNFSALRALFYLFVKVFLLILVKFQN